MGAGDTGTPGGAATAAGRPSGLVEPLVTFLVATAIASALYWTGRVVPLVNATLHGAIAIVFLYAPALAARLSRRPFDYRAAGLRLEPVRLNLAVAAVALAITWPVFIAAFLAFYGTICAPDPVALARPFADAFAPLCVRWRGLDGAHLALPGGFLTMALSQLVVVAVPEEMFFRGYLMGRLEERWPSRRRLLGAPIGRPLLISSALFALGHVLVDFQPQRLAVFFPALAFGWMRARTGSIAAAALFHALCNLLSEALHVSFFG
jgi:uncharacterized protein